MRVNCSRAALLLLCVTIGGGLSAFAKEKRHAPLPQAVLQAKTVYLDNRSGYASLGDKAYDELEKWGRFKVVQSPKEADLIFLLSASEYRGGYITTGTSQQQGRVDDSGNVQMTGTNESTTQQMVYRSTHLTVIDPKSGDALWEDSKRWGNLYNGFHSATRSLIKNLRERIEEQE
jgi:hypothetical protein